MKITIYTMIVLLAFNTSVLFAGGIKHYTLKSETNKIETTIDLEKLAPSTPLFAEFADGNEYKASMVVLISNLAPSTPKEADFEDACLLVRINTEQLAPISPKEPDFEDIATDLSGISGLLAPSTPTEADFTD